MNPAPGQRWYHEGYKMVIEITAPTTNGYFESTVIQSGISGYFVGKAITYYAERFDTILQYLPGQDKPKE